MTSPERLAGIALACLVEPGSPGVAEMVAELGVGATLSRLRTQRRRARVVGRLDPDDVPGMLAEMSRCGVRVVLPGEPEFPSQLLDLPEPPLALWIRGPLDLRAAALRSVAVVGARACTAYGERATASLAGGLAEDGWAVVSGGAFGIDAAAHRAALAVCGPTVAVLACGVDVAYPRAHDALLCRIADSGLVVSELAAGQPAAQAPIPRPQPGDRGAEPGHGRGRGCAAQRCGVHRLPGPRTGPGRHGGPGPGHVNGKLRYQPAAARAGGPCRQRQRRGRVTAAGIGPRGGGAGHNRRLGGSAGHSAPDKLARRGALGPGRASRRRQVPDGRGCGCGSGDQPCGLPGAPGTARDRGTRPTHRVGMAPMRLSRGAAWGRDPADRAGGGPCGVHHAPARRARPRPQHRPGLPQRCRGPAGLRRRAGGGPAARPRSRAPARVAGRHGPARGRALDDLPTCGGRSEASPRGRCVRASSRSIRLLA